MARLLAAFLAGLLFGAGLSLSRMIDPAIVLAFLDLGAIAEGAWDGRLALVMAGALAVTAVGYRAVFRRGAPLCAPAFVLPTQRAIDTRLIAGAVTFGVGWGLCGYCPGPVIAGLTFGPMKTWVFAAAMLAGIALHHVLFERSAAGPGSAALRGTAGDSAH